MDDPDLTVIIQTFKDSSKNAQLLLFRIQAIPLSKDIIVNDDAYGHGSSFWLPLLKGGNEFYVAAPNLNEPRAYNRLALMARGELLIFVQGDFCLPSNSLWVADAVRLFNALPRLAMLSGRAGFSETLDYRMEREYRNNRTWGASPYLPIDHLVRVDDGQDAIPFKFLLQVDNGPLLYRRSALLQARGFDESFQCASGAVGTHYDSEMSMHFWTNGWEVGVFYGATLNGLGGRKTQRSNAHRNSRHTTETWNADRVNSNLRRSGAAIRRRIAESTQQQLVPIAAAERDGVRSRREALLGKHTSSVAQCGVIGLAAARDSKTTSLKAKSKGKTELGKR